MIKIAILADLHLPDCAGTVKEDVFEWALTTAIKEKVDVIVGVGDLTSVGTLDAARRVREKLNKTNLPLLIVPGNAELRNPEISREVLKELQTSVIFEKSGYYVVGLDSSKQALTDKDRKIITELAQQGHKQIFVVTHFPLSSFPAEDKKFLTEFIKCGTIGCFVAGHIHCDATEQIGLGHYHQVRGIDPDKAIGGPPALTLFKYDSHHKQWQRSELIFPDGCALSWLDKQRTEFKDLLGISAMEDSLGGINIAISHKIKNIELRFESTKNISLEKLCSLVKKWRNQGGQHLSIHMPDISWDHSTRMVKGTEDAKTACELALALGVNMLTMHVPSAPVGLVTNHADIKDKLLNTYVDTLKIVLEKGITVGIENLHMKLGEKPDMKRGFGYTPTECRDWIFALRTKTSSDKIGFLFDIGHAYNNAPYSSLYNISQWFAELGNLIVGYHLHQVDQDANGQFINHSPVTGVFGPFISFSSLFAAWNKGQINHAPMYLEIRNKGGLDSLFCFRNYLVT